MFIICMVVEHLSITLIPNQFFLPLHSSKAISVHQRHAPAAVDHWDHSVCPTATTWRLLLIIEISMRRQIALLYFFFVKYGLILLFYCPKSLAPHQKSSRLPSYYYSSWPIAWDGPKPRSGRPARMIIFKMVLQTQIDRIVCWCCRYGWNVLAIMMWVIYCTTVTLAIRCICLKISFETFG